MSALLRYRSASIARTSVVPLLAASMTRIMPLVAATSSTKIHSASIQHLPSNPSSSSSTPPHLHLAHSHHFHTMRRFEARIVPIKPVQTISTSPLVTFNRWQQFCDAWFKSRFKAGRRHFSSSPESNKNDTHGTDPQLPHEASTHANSSSTPPVIAVPPEPATPLLDAHPTSDHPTTSTNNTLASNSTNSPSSVTTAATDHINNVISTVTAAVSEASAKAAATAAEIARTKFTPIPTVDPDSDLDSKKDNDAEAASIRKMPSSDTIIRGTLWFDNMYPMRVHWLDLRYLLATQNHQQIIPKVFAQVFGVHGFRLIGATPRANEGGVFVHFEVTRQDQIRTPEDVSKALITHLRAKPVHALLTPKAVRCHLVKGAPFLDDLASRFPYNRLKIEVKGPATALQDLTIEQLYGEFSQFGKIFDLTLNNYEKDKPRTGVIQYVRMFSAVGARNCLHRLRLAVPLTVSSLPATVPPKVEEAGAAASTPSKPPPPPTADAYLYLTYDSILKTSYVTDFFVKHPRIMVPLLGLLFAAFTYLIFDPLRTFNITNHITGRLAWHELYGKLPWPFGWLKEQASELGNSSMFKMLRRGAGLEMANEGTMKTSWSARQADEEKVKKWLNSNPDRLLFITGPKGAGKQALVRKLTADRKNVVMLDIGHIIDRPDDEFVKGLSAAVGFTPGFALLTWISNIMDVFTPGASKASGSSTASSAQILKVLECTAHALVNIAKKEHAKQRKEQRARYSRMTPAEREALSRVPVQEIDEEEVAKATSQQSRAAGEMDKPPVVEEKKPEQEQSSIAKLTSSIAGAVGLGGVTGAKAAQQATQQSSSTPATASTSSTSAAAASKESPPSNNTFTPLSNASIGSTATTADASPVRLSEPKVAPQIPDTSHMTEQQRNYLEFIRSQKVLREQAKKVDDEKAAAAKASPSSNEDDKSGGRPNHLGGLVEHEPDNLPLFIIDGFNQENASKHSNFLQVLVSWSAELSAAGVARFVYLTDATLEESVSKSLPDVKLAEVLLSDASPEAAEEFLFSSLPPQMRRAMPDAQTKAALRILGGRYNDLVTCMRGVENGNHPIETVEEIVVQSMNAVKGLLFTEDKNVKWSKVQMWQVLTMLVNSPTSTVLYDDVLFNIFQGDDIPLKSLVRADLLRVEPALSAGGDRIKAGSPVMNEAFNRLLHQQDKLRPGMDLLVVKWQIGQEQSKINAIEEELMRIAQTADEMIGQSAMMGGGGASHAHTRAEKGSYVSSSSSGSASASNLLNRQKFLLQLLNDSHEKIVTFDAKRRQCEKEVKQLKKVEA